MKIINNQEEMNVYYNGETNTYEFIENNRLIDIKIDFDLNIKSNIMAQHINARDINARNINANKISFNAVCFAYKTFVCNAIIGRRENSKYFCLDSEVVIKSKQ